MIFFVLLSIENGKINHSNHSIKLYQNHSLNITSKNHSLKLYPKPLNQNLSKSKCIKHFIQSNVSKFIHRPPPTAPHVIASLCHVRVTTELLSSADALDCAVCRCDLELDESVVELPCKHLYHRECITPWLEQTSTCPTCRHQLPTADTKFERRRRRT